MEKPLPSYGKMTMPAQRQKSRTLSAKKGRTSPREKTALRSYIYKAPLLLAGYFGGAFSALGGFNPLGIAFVTAFLGEGTLFYFVLLTVFAGYLYTSAFGVQMYAVALCFSALAKFFIFGEKKKYGISQGAMGAVCLLMGAVVFSIMNGGSLYLLVRGGVESICVVAFSEIIRRSIHLYEGGIHRKILSQEEILCLGTVLVLGLCVIAGVGTWGFEAAMFLGTFLLMVICFKAGTQAVALSVVLGLVFVLLQRGSKELFLMLSIATLLGGVFSKRRIFVVLGFWTGFIVPGFYLNGLPPQTTFWMLAWASGMFLLMPPKALNVVNTYQYHKKEFDYSDYYVKLKEMMEERLVSFAGVFGSLAGAFEVEDVPTQLLPQDANKVVDTISGKVCAGCEMSLYCWRAKNYETFEGIHRLIGAVEKKGRAEKDDFTPWLKESCVLQKEILDTTNFFGREYKNNLIWQSRLNQLRSLVKDQLQCVERILGDVTTFELPQPVFYESMSKEIRQRLLKKGIPVSKVYVSSAGREGMSVTITKEACFGNNQCRNHVLFTVNNVLGKGFAFTKQSCGADEKGNCLLVLKEQKGLKLKTAIAAVTKEGSEKSGDTYYWEETEDKKGILALCDGMGTGESAASESKKAVNLVGKFIHAGFPLELTMKTLNSVLAVENKEMYTTMDVVCVDLYNGHTEIIKNGDSTIFILKEGKIKTIRSQSLPMGVFTEWEGEVTKTSLAKGDYIIMVTDGVTDSLGIEQEKETVIKAYENSEDSIDRFAANILKQALSQFDGEARDDMTVMISVVC